MKTKSDINIELLADILCYDMEYHSIKSFCNLDISLNTTKRFLSMLWLDYWNLTPVQRLEYDIPEYTQMINKTN